MNSASILQDRAYPDLKTWVLDHSGLAYYSDKDEDLATRVARRLEARNMGGCASYLRLIQKNSEELDCLIGELTIGETYFFRQKEHFDILAASILPALIERNRDKRVLRIWSAGCATGAEPYSLAVLLARQFPEVARDWDVSILATDINVDFLTRARAGVFNEWALRETPPHIRALCFEKLENKWRLRNEYRGLVAFRYHNLAARAKAPFGPFDIILCRNVLIYFSSDLVEIAAERFHEQLDEDGWLLVGHAEASAAAFRNFHPVSTPAGTVYKKGPGGEPSIPIAIPVPVLPEIPFELPPLPIVAAAVPAPKPSPLPVPIPLSDIRILADRGRWQLALEAAEKLASTDPLNAPAHFTLGLIREHEGSYEEAADALGKAIYLDRSFALAHYHLAAARAATGDKTSAKRSFTNALRLVRTMTPSEPLAHGDGITAGELKDLADMHLQLIAHD